MNGTLPEKKETKIALLFTPEELHRNYQVLQSLQITKSAKGINYDLGDLNRHEVYKLFPSLSQDAKVLLLKFQGEAIGEIKPLETGAGEGGGRDAKRCVHVTCLHRARSLRSRSARPVNRARRPR